MSAVELDHKNFEDTITNNDIVVVDFWAPWCGPCKSFAPIYEAVSEEIEDVVFAKVNTEDQQDLAGHFQIRSIPTLMIFREQIVIFSQAGMVPAEGLRDLVAKARELDMDDVRKQIQEQEA
ncbi:MAG: thioredoxin [Gammaproteobacteria bacterium]|jgi:thioredoxin 1|nr:thioredoxin [Gammaproteobacteria bacterium]MBT3490572.1 thioredoxin [Gammaproteobacteria bacterium]MBT3718362.1 thioredoxin [Gammaproteobacteria bacterium]MBT3845170.1 thioredoxin [Gammaproteobacteria bacterium]MBT3892679.1 thioredoxin [Gammaproteobacteria bacterium]